MPECGSGEERDRVRERDEGKGEGGTYGGERRAIEKGEEIEQGKGLEKSKGGREREREKRVKE